MTAIASSIRRRQRDSAEQHSAPAELETVGCLLCGSLQFETVLVAPAAESAAAGHFRVVRCRSCALVFTNPRPTPASIARFYPPGYEPHASCEWDTSWRGRVKRRLEHAVLRARFGYPPRPVGTATRLLAAVGRVWFRGRRHRAAWVPYRGRGELLDFGCGSGQFLRRMREYGWTVQGVDLSEPAARRAERESGIRVHVGSLPHPAVRPGRFDVVTMWNALEHVHQPRAVVRAARAALRPGGLLVVASPNFASWSSRTFREAWFGLDLPRHLVHFTPETLRELLQLEGLRVGDTDHIGRDGWLRHSARRAARTGSRALWTRACCWNPLARLIARWTELTDQADFVRVVAQKNDDASRT